MIAVTIAGQACWLLPYQHGDASPLKLSVSIPVDYRRGLTGGSSRRPEAILPRYSWEFRAIILQSEFARLRAASLAAQDEPILCPLWPHAYAPGGSSALTDSGGASLTDSGGSGLIDSGSTSGTATITSGLWVAYAADWSSYAVNPSSLTGYDFIAPLLYGRFSKPPRLVAHTDGFVVAEFSVEEDAPAAYALAPASGILPADTTFANATGYSAPVFPFVADWTSPPAPSYAVTDVSREKIGPGRQKLSNFYPQTPEQLQTADFTGVGATEAAQALAWWIRRSGETDAHWVATNQSLWHLSASASAGDTVIHLTSDTPAPAIGDNLAINAGSTEFARVTGVSGFNITLAAPLANAWNVRDTRVSPAMLARHTNAALEINYSPAGWIASFALAWRELAAEYAVPTGETRGATLGRLPAYAWFFQIDLDYNGAIASTYLTNWESGATGVGGHVWTYNPCDFDKLIQSDDLSDDSCTFSLRWFAGCPWENWQPGILAARGFLTIYRANVASDGTFSAFTQIWSGELSTPTDEGASLSVRVIGANAQFGKRAPKQVMSLTCGTSFCSTRCGLLFSDWTFNATIASVAANVITVGAITRANGSSLPSGFGAADYFALGFISWTAAGLPQREGILTSAAMSGGQIVLTLDRPCALSAGASLQMVPGCDRQAATCSGHFANLARFRGFPFMPSVSPSFIIPIKQQTTAKK